MHYMLELPIIPPANNVFLLAPERSSAICLPLDGLRTFEFEQLPLLATTDTSCSEVLKEDLPSLLSTSTGARILWSRSRDLPGIMIGVSPWPHGKRALKGDIPKTCDNLHLVHNALIVLYTVRDFHFRNRTIHSSPLTNNHRNTM